MEAVAVTEHELSESPPVVGAAKRGNHPMMALLVICMCQLMMVLDASIVNIALPDIERALNFSPTGLSWVVNAYTLTFGGLLLLGGRAGDIFGRRRMFISGLIVFTGASALGGFAQSSNMLLAARVLQGVGASLASPAALSLITTNFEVGQPRTRALAVFSSISAAGLSIGLILGGMLTEWASWRWVMFVNVPIGIAVILLAPLFINESERSKGRIDIVGALTSAGGVAALVYGFIRTSENGWGESGSIVSFAAAVILLVVFVIYESRIDNPLMPLRLFKHRNRAGSYLNMLILPAAMFGQFFFLSQFLQEIAGMSPIKTGFAFIPFTACLFLATRLVPRLLPKFGPKPLMIVSASLIVLSLLSFTQLNVDTNFFPTLMIPMMVLGFGAGLAFGPMSVTILSSVERHEAGSASGLLQTMQQVGGSLGLAILVTRFGTSTRNAANKVYEGLTPEMREHTITANAMADAFQIAVAIAVIVLLVAIFVIKPVRTRPS
ncbi:MAG: MFS transporter, partial [Thermomicrobiales bacterium]